MLIIDYRVQSVLRTYSRHLRRSKLSDRLSADDRECKDSADPVAVSEEARHRLIMERVTSGVLEKAIPKKEGGDVEVGQTE